MNEQNVGKKISLCRLFDHVKVVKTEIFQICEYLFVEFSEGRTEM